MILLREDMCELSEGDISDMIIEVMSETNKVVDYDLAFKVSDSVYMRLLADQLEVDDHYDPDIDYSLYVIYELIIDEISEFERHDVVALFKQRQAEVLQ